MTDYDPDFGGTIQKPNPRRGNRIIRILVVLGILVLLFAFSLPASRSAVCRTPRTVRQQPEANRPGSAKL